MRRFGLRDIAYLAQASGGGGDPCGDPPALASLKLWFDAGRDVLNGGGTPASDGGDVGIWTNSGGATDALQPVLGNRPTYHLNQINSRPIIRFSATKFLTVADGVDTDIPGTECLAYVVAKTNTQQWNVAMSKYGVSTLDLDYSFGIDPNPRWFFLGNWPTIIDTGATFATNGVFHKMYVRNDNGTHFTGAKIYLNSTTQIGSTSSFKAGNPNNNPAYIGARYDSLWSDQDIAEIGVYHGNLSDADFALLDTYINCKYGL